MRRTDREIADPRAMEEILSRAQVVRLVMMDGPEPCIVPMSFGYEDRTLYFHSAHTGRKIDCIRRDPIVWFEADMDVVVREAPEACGWGMNYRSVVGRGIASIIENSAAKAHALNAIMRKYAGRDFPFTPPAIDSVTVFQVAIVSMTGKTCGY